MALFRKTKKLATRVAQNIWNDTTTRNAEKHRNNYRPNDIEARAAMERALGEVHIWAARNADVCAQQPLRLYRRVVEGEERGTRGVKAVSKRTKQYMLSRQGGQKAASFAEGGGDIEEVLDHPVLDLLASPHPDFPGTQLAWIKFYMQEITGKAYQAVGLGADGLPDVLLPLLTQFTEIVYGDDGDIEGYQYARSETSVAVFNPEDIMYFRHRVSRFNPNDGEGPLSAVFPHADAVVKNLMFDLAMIDNGNKPDSMLSVNDPLASTTQLDALDSLINSKFGGYRNGHKTFVHKGDMTWTPMAWPEKELQSLAKVTENKKTIRLAFGIPESMVDSNASTMASALVADNQYAKMTIRPRLNQDAAHLNDLLLPLFGLDTTNYCLMYDDPVIDDVEALSIALNAKVAAGRITINEARLAEGIDPSDDPGADELRINGQTLKSLDTQPDPLAGLGGGLDAPGMFRGLDTRGASVKTKQEASTAFIFKGMIDDELPEWRPCQCVHTKDDDDIANEPMIEQVFRDHLRGVERAFEDVVADMQDEVVDAVRNGRPSDLDPMRNQAASVLRDEMATIIDDAVKFTLEAAGQDVAGMFDVAQTTALEFFERHVIMVADDIASTTDSMIRPAIQRGLDQGLSIDRIASDMETLPKWRAERIARTEVQNAAQGGRYETFKEIGVELVQWVNAPGATDAHKTIANRIYYKGGERGVQKMGQPFVTRWMPAGNENITRNVYYPPARPNCRCSVRAIYDTSGDDE